jgi:hypothetical protein
MMKLSRTWGTRIVRVWNDNRKSKARVVGLFALGFDLSVYEVEAVLGFGDLGAEVGGQLGEEVAVFEAGGFGVEVEVGDFAGEERGAFGVEGGDVAVGVTELAGEAEELGGRTFAGDGGGGVVVVVEDALEGVDVAAGVGGVGEGHEAGEVGLLGGVAGEVGVDALGDVAEESFECGRWVELFGFAGFGEGGVVGFVGTLAGFGGVPTGGVGVVEIDFPLGDAGFKVVQLGVEDADLAEVTAFKGLELGAEVG